MFSTSLNLSRDVVLQAVHVQHFEIKLYREFDIRQFCYFRGVKLSITRSVSHNSRLKVSPHSSAILCLHVLRFWQLQQVFIRPSRVSFVAVTSQVNL